VPDFSRVINLAYERILGRSADSPGLEGYNQAMNLGLTEADMRETLIRSQEYANKNPDRSVTRATRGMRKKTAKKTASKKATKARSRKR
jgi:hypothetical protein